MVYGESVYKIQHSMSDGCIYQFADLREWIIVFRISFVEVGEVYTHPLYHV